MQSIDPSLKYSKIDLYLELAVLLYMACSSVQRVSDSVRWLARHFGDKDIHLYVGSELIEISIFQGDSSQSRIFAINGPSKVNVSVLHEVSRLLHNIPAYNRDIISIRAELNRIKNAKPVYPVPVMIILIGLACAALGWINHGDFQALWVIWVSSVVAMIVRYKLWINTDNLYLSILVTALSGGLCAALIIPISQTQTPDVTLICSVLFLIPGVMLINGGMDIIRDHSNSGIARLTSVLTQIFIITGALLFPLAVTHINVNPLSSNLDSALIIFTIAIAAGIAAIGFATLFNTPISALAGCFICGITARLIRDFGFYFGLDVFLSILIGMTIATLCAIVIGKYTNIPAVVLAVTAGIPMLPNLALIQGLQGIFVIAHPGTPTSESVLMFALQHMFYAGVVISSLIVSIIFTIILITGKSPRI